MTETEKLTAWLVESFPSLRHEPEGMMKHPYLVQGGHYSAGGKCFLWDDFFQAVRLWHEGSEYADVIRGTVECYLDTVNPDTGQGLKVISPGGPLQGGDEQLSPFLCQFAFTANQLSPFDEAQERTLQLLSATLEYWQRERGTSYGLCRWADSWESSIDMNPAVDMWPPRTVVGVDLNAYLVLEYRALAELAKQWGKASEANLFGKQAEMLADNIRKHLWNDKAKLFCNLDNRTGKHVLATCEGLGDEFNVVPWTNFTPLYVGIATEKQAKETIERYLLNGDAFRCAYGFRTFDRCSVFYTEQRVCIPSFVDQRPDQRTGSNWQGPVWVLSNYMLAKGLANYGYRKEALAVAEDTVRLCRQNIEEFGGMFENYHPKTGKGLYAVNMMSWNILADVIGKEIESGKGALGRVLRTLNIEH